MVCTINNTLSVFYCRWFWNAAYVSIMAERYPTDCIRLLHFPTHTELTLNLSHSSEKLIRYVLYFAAVAHRTEKLHIRQTIEARNEAIAGCGLEPNSQNGCRFSSLTLWGIPRCRQFGVALMKPIAISLHYLEVRHFSKTSSIERSDDVYFSCLDAARYHVHMITQ